MEQVNVLFFILSTFFGLGNPSVLADKTTVTINPQAQRMEITQEDLFTFSRSAEEAALVLKQWEKIVNWEDNETPWSTELAAFPGKKLTLLSGEGGIRTRITISYTNPEDLEVFGIWYDAGKDRYSTNQVPQLNIKTETGELAGNYWRFNGEGAFSFVVEPFLQLPEKILKTKISVAELLAE
ncbi:hypothetical protein [Neolewinella antarctica]|uniref:Uncharacterized protein n=1 Tax=Neolewinella antarctica TaxID=442734 RepID=A0ABX0X9I8_9BACT|nr:hypothetical protein [Neolewinella antarctica]NJC25928.1 hypothetical protein [Neolewinella antarctica]